MIEECKSYLVQKVKEAGIKSIVHTTMKNLVSSQESHIGGVLFEGDKFEKSGSKTIYKDDFGNKYKRFKKFDRKTSFTIIIGEYDQSKCELIFENFMMALDDGIVVNGNFVPIEVEDADWVDKDDSILKAKVAVQVKVIFDGGIYKDSQYAKLTKYEIQEISMDKEEKHDK